MCHMKLWGHWILMFRNVFAPQCVLNPGAPRRKMETPSVEEWHGDSVGGGRKIMCSVVLKKTRACIQQVEALSITWWGIVCLMMWSLNEALSASWWGNSILMMYIYMMRQCLPHFDYTLLCPYFQSVSEHIMSLVWWGLANIDQLMICFVCVCVNHNDP